MKTNRRMYECESVMQLIHEICSENHLLGIRLKDGSYSLRNQHKQVIHIPRGLSKLDVIILITNTNL